MFNFSFDKRTMYIIIAVLIGLRLLTYITNPGVLVALLFSIPGVLIAITFHEFAHGLAAYKLGDNTAKNEGRLTLNPLRPNWYNYVIICRIWMGKACTCKSK